MNAPESIAPINPAHEVLMKADSAMCVEQVAQAVVGKKPTKVEIKAIAKKLKELADLGLIEMEPRAGGVPFYRLITAPTPAVCDSVQTEGSKQTETPELVLTPEAQAERDQFVAEHGHDGNCSCHISPPCGSCMHPGNPRNQEEDETAWMDAPAEEPSQPLNFATSPELQYLAPEDYVAPPADPALLALANRELHAQLEAKDNELFIQSKVVVVLRQRIAQLDEQVSSLTTDVTQTRTALNYAINESDRLRNELIIERQAREALQEQLDAHGAIEAVSYIVRIPKSDPKPAIKLKNARKLALAAVRSGASKALVFPVGAAIGMARRGAEWKAVKQ